MNTLFIVLSLAALALAGAKSAPSLAKEDDKHHEAEEPKPTALNRSLLNGNDDLAFYEFEGMTFMILEGEDTKFTAVNNNGTCVRVEADDDEGSVCPLLLNQTLCDTIAATVCEPATANLTCSEPSVPVENGNGDDNGDENGNGYEHGGPLCHIEVGGKKVQPSAESMFLFIAENQVKECHFVVAPAPQPDCEADKRH